MDEKLSVYQLPDGTWVAREMLEPLESVVTDDHSAVNRSALQGSRVEHLAVDELPL